MEAVAQSCRVVTFACPSMRVAKKSTRDLARERTRRTYEGDAPCDLSNIRLTIPCVGSHEDETLFSGTSRDVKPSSSRYRVERAALGGPMQGKSSHAYSPATVIAAKPIARMRCCDLARRGSDALSTARTEAMTGQPHLGQLAASVETFWPHSLQRTNATSGASHVAPRDIILIKRGKGLPDSRFADLKIVLAGLNVRHH